MEMFSSFSINAIPREENTFVDSLAVVANTLETSQEILAMKCKVEVIFRPSVPNDHDHWQIFDSDSQIIQFLKNMDTF